MVRIEYRYSRRRLWPLFVLSLLLAGGSLLAAVHQAKAGDAWLSWAGAILFGAAVPLFGFMLFDRRPRLVLDDTGVDDRRLKLGLIPWNAIHSGSLRKVQRSHYISLELRDPELWLKKLTPMQARAARASRGMGLTEFNLTLALLDTPPEDIFREFSLRLAAAPAPQTQLAPPPAVIEAESLAGFATRLQALGGRAPVTPLLVAINVSVFAYAGMHGAGWLGANGEVLVGLGTNFGPLTLGGQWWRLFTCMFLHFGLLHIGMNMWALWDSGRVAEKLYGSARFLLLYLLAGLGGSVASLLWNPSVNSAGASGAIFGVFGGLLAFFMRGRHEVPLSVVARLRNSTMSFIAYSLFFGLSHAGIDNAAHIGGLAGGFLIGLALARPFTEQARVQAHPLRLAGVLLLAGGVLAALAPARLYLSPALATELQFRSDVDWFAQQEGAAVQSFNALLKASKDNALDDTHFAERIEREVQPAWDAMLARFNAEDTLPPDSRLARRQTLLRQYAASRQAGFQLLARAARSGDSGAMQQADRKFDEGHQLIDQLNALPPD